MFSYYSTSRYSLVCQGSSEVCRSYHGRIFSITAQLSRDSTTKEPVPTSTSLYVREVGPVAFSIALRTVLKSCCADGLASLAARLLLRRVRPEPSHMLVSVSEIVCVVEEHAEELRAAQVWRVVWIAHFGRGPRTNDGPPHGIHRYLLCISCRAPSIVLCSVAKYQDEAKLRRDGPTESTG